MSGNETTSRRCRDMNEMTENLNLSCDSEAENESFWLAFRYVSGEMSAFESAAFEEQLADDSRLCEAVSRAVLLCDDLAAGIESACDSSLADGSAEAEVADTQRRNIPAGRRARRIAVLTAASAVAATSALVFSHLQNSPELSRNEQAVEALQLVSGWASSDRQIDSVSVLADARDSLPGDLADDLSETDVPDWLLFAVQASLHDGNDEVVEN